MEVKAKARYIRMSPKKVRLVLDVIRGMDAEEALKQLRFINKAAARPIKKLLDSAIANAVNNFSLEKSNLFIKRIFADGGPTLKRWKPRAFGRAAPIRKKSSHINIILGEKVESKDVKKKEQELSAPVKIGELSKIKDEEKRKEKGPFDVAQGREKRKEDGEKRKKKEGKGTEADEEVRLDAAGRLVKKESAFAKASADKKGMDEMRKKERKGFFKGIFNRKTGQK